MQESFYMTSLFLRVVEEALGLLRKGKFFGPLLTKRLVRC